MNLESQIPNLEFKQGESRTVKLAVRPLGTTFDVRCMSIENKGQYRFYESQIKDTAETAVVQNIKIQLNHGDPADDQARIEEIVKEILNPASDIRDTEELQDEGSGITVPGSPPKEAL